MVKQIDRSLGEITKRLFWLVGFRKWAYGKYVIVSFFNAINLVIHVLFLQNITLLLELKDAAGFNKMLLFYIGFILGYEILNFSMKKWGWMETIPMGISDIYNKYLTHYIKLDNNKVEAVGTGKLIGIIEKGAYEWVESVANIFERGIALFVAVVFTVYMVGRVESVYAIVFIVLMIIFYFLGKYSNTKSWEFRKIRYELRNERLKLLVMVLMSKIEILQTGKISNEITKTISIGKKQMKVNKDMSVHRTLLKRVSQFGMSVLLFVSFWYLGNQYLVGEISLSILVGLTGTLIIMQKTIAETISFYVDLTKRYVSIVKLWDFFDSTPEIAGYDTGKTFKYKNGEIEIKNMSFAYDKNMPVFQNFNLQIPGGKVIAFVGNSGSGKSTLVKIISGYLTHDSGEVVIDGQRNKDISLKSLYKHVGYLTQEPSVFDGSILENLTYGIENPLLTSPKGRGIAEEKGEDSFSLGGKDAGKADRGLSMEELNKIIKLAKCEFINDFPNGLETEIGEKGIRLSGGQRQRLAIAKIFLKNPEIIILDEPTSALDSFSEEQITIAMNNLFKGRTVIIIAHRLQTVKNADKILVLENGKIVEEGNHKDLIKQKGVYKKMLDLQSGF